MNTQKIANNKVLIGLTISIVVLNLFVAIKVTIDEHDSDYSGLVVIYFFFVWILSLFYSLFFTLPSIALYWLLKRRPSNNAFLTIGMVYFLLFSLYFFSPDLPLFNNIPLNNIPIFRSILVEPIG